MAFAGALPVYVIVEFCPSHTGVTVKRDVGRGFTVTVPVADDEQLAVVPVTV